jgi:hypothetical protein
MSQREYRTEQMNSPKEINTNEIHPTQLGITRDQLFIYRIHQLSR